MRLLGRRELTRAELTLKLTDRGYPPEVVAPEVERLVLDRSVDDRRTAFAYVRTASRIKGRGPLRIRRELEAKGVSKALIAEAIASLPAGDDLEAIRRFIQRKRLPARPAPADRRRLFQQLLRKGFPPDAITRALGTRDEES